MKLVSFMLDGRARYGAVKNGGVVDFSAALGGRCPDLLSALEQAALPELEVFLASAQPDVALAGLDYLPVLARPPKIICVGINYDDHRIEAGKDMPQRPMLFPRFFDSLTAHEKPIIRPRVSDNLDWEAELAVVIGKPGRHIPAARAMPHVAGYACFNDASVRDYQKRTSQWTIGKNFDGTGGFGPALVTADELPAGCVGRRIQSRLNGQVMQDADTSDMVFGVAQTISLLSQCLTLEPGDVIVMGTPGGVGYARTPPVWLKAGDTIEIEIEGVGLLSNPVTA